jgi:hypothetical protein
VNARHLISVVVLCATAARGALSQTAAPSAHEGDRIRVQRFDIRHPRIGKLVSRSDDSLTVEWLNGTRESMPMFEIEQLEVSSGHRHFVVRGAAYGLAIGTALGFAIKKFADHDRPDDPYSGRTNGTNALFVTVGGGAVFGALAGALGTEHWQRTPLAGRRGRVGLLIPARQR